MSNNRHINQARIIKSAVKGSEI